MNCNRLPSLPGLSFDERLKKNHHVSHSFYYQNGYRMDRTPTVGIGKEPIQETFKDFYSEPIEYVICFKCVIFFFGMVLGQIVFIVWLLELLRI